jgi:Flp pilus assembly protein TadG
MDKRTARCRTMRREKGSVAVVVALSLVVLLGLAAFAIDIGRWVMVRHELQNAADAAALAGAQTLPGQLVADAATMASAAAAATSAANQYAGANAANGQAASAQSVLVGYWDVNRANVPASVPTTLSQTISTPTDKPAVLVTVGLKGNANLPLMLGPLLGVSSLPVSATAVATVSAPGIALPGALLPVALNQCMFQNPTYWNNGLPVASSLSTEIEIGNGATASGCTGPSAQWTSLTLDSNASAYGPCSGDSPSSVPAVDCLITNGNGPALSIGQNIDISPGVKASIYNNFPATPPMVVTVPVVADGSLMSGGGDTPIVGFAGFSVDYVIGANGKSTPACTTNPVCLNPPCTKCILGHIVATPAGSTEAGGLSTSYYGALTPPSLAVLPSSAWY